MKFEDVEKTRVNPKCIAAYTASDNPSQSSYNTHPYKLHILIQATTLWLNLAYRTKEARDRDQDRLDNINL